MAAELYDSGLTLPEGQRQFRQLILKAGLAHNDGNLCRTAAELDIHRNTASRIKREINVEATKK